MTESDIKESENSSPQRHPDLEKLYVMKAVEVNLNNNNSKVQENEPPERFMPNKIYDVETENFVGQFIFMIRTPDVDSSSSTSSASSSDDDDDDKTKAKAADDNERKIKEYFRNKKRRFEYQIQIRWKNVPESTLHMSTEFATPVTHKMGFIQTAIANASLGFIRKFNKGFHYSLTGGVPKNSKGSDDDVDEDILMAEGKYELPHVAFPVLECMDCLACTKINEETSDVGDNNEEALPKLGKEIYEDPKSVADRKKGGKGNFVGWRKDYVYTMSVYSAYADFLMWKVVNIPGLRSFSFSNIVGDSAMLMSMYVLKNEENDNDGDITTSRAHYAKDKQYMFSVEISNTNQALGDNAKKWLAATEESTQEKQKKNHLENDKDDDTEEEEEDEEQPQDSSI